MPEKKYEPKWINTVTSFYKEDDIFWNNEINANIFVSLSLLILAFVLILSYVFANLQFFEVSMDHLRIALAVNLPVILASIIISNIYKGQKHWIKYLLCVTTVLVSCALCATLNMFVSLVVVVPVILSVRYYSARLTRNIAIIGLAGMALSLIIFGFDGVLDLNLVTIPANSVLDIPNDNLREAIIANGYDMKAYMSSIFRGSFIPRLLFYIIISFSCVELARRAHDNIIEQAAISRKTESMRTELNMASAIQSGVLPKIFPPYPDRKEFEIFASMTPAKEVGGDFYDFFMVDDDHMVLVMADVSGKGVPASLFMMTSRILLKTSALHLKSPAEIAQSVNDMLCTDNALDMFVTVWLGILQISTGVVTSVDAGHEYPILCHADGSCEVFKDKKGFVMGGMEAVHYRETSFTLAPGDTLFLYTDGVPEATNGSEELFGMDRTLNALRSTPQAGPKDRILSLKADVDAFVGSAPQFDDMTMLALRYNGAEGKEA